MHRYRNLDGHSGVLAYEFGEGWIRIRFAGGETYEYTDAASGAEHVRNMQTLAQAGEGLATYVSRFVHEAYARKL